MLYEIMTLYEANGFKVRVWSKTDKFTMGPDKRVLDQLSTYMFPILIHAALIDLDYVSAFEIIDSSDNGCVTYNEWP